MDPFEFIRLFVRGKRIAADEHARWLAIQNAWFSWLAQQGSASLDHEPTTQKEAARVLRLLGRARRLHSDTWPMVRRPLTQIAGTQLAIGLRGQVTYLMASDPVPLKVNFEVRPTSRTRRLIPFGYEELWDGYDLLTLDSRAARQVTGSNLREAMKRLACTIALVYRHGHVELSWPASSLDVISSGAAADVVLAAVHRGSEGPYR